MIILFTITLTTILILNILQNMFEIYENTEWNITILYNYLNIHAS